MDDNQKIITLIEKIGVALCTVEDPTSTCRLFALSAAMSVIVTELARKDACLNEAEVDRMRTNFTDKILEYALSLGEQAVIARGN